MKSYNLSLLFENILTGNRLSAEEALSLIKKYSWENLAPWSNRLREHFKGNRISLCTIINAKNGSCDMDCRFCSQSAYSAAKAAVYPLIPGESIRKALASAEANHAVRCGIVTSGGRLNSNDIRLVGEYIREHGKKYGVAVCGSFGRLNPEDLLYLKECGLTRIHHNLESSRNFYPEICSTQTWDSRLETIKEALSLGLSVCSGGLFCMGESWKDRIDLAITLRETGIRNIPLNFLIPHPGTLFAGKPVIEEEEALKIIALYRFLIPDATLRICGGRPQVFRKEGTQIFRAGADALMTGNYLTAAGLSPEKDHHMIRHSGMKITALQLKNV